jgi:RecB family exonuclease
MARPVKTEPTAGSASGSLLFEARFLLELDPGDGAEPIRVAGVIDRIDRLPDGSIEVIDYKTGRSKSQREVDEDEQLNAFRARIVEMTHRLRSGDFAANPDYRRCSYCDWRRLCPSRWGEA